MIKRPESGLFNQLHSLQPSKQLCQALLKAQSRYKLNANFRKLTFANEHKNTKWG